MLIKAMVAALVAAGAIVTPAMAQQPVRAVVEPPPNVVFVLIDDADTKLLAYMPATTSLIADRGATLTNFLYNQPLCCPSRASMLRGQYSQNTGVERNLPPDGGYSAFYSKGNEASTVGTWFDDAGYATAHIGKYLNGYAEEAGLPATHIPPGWDHWFGLLGKEGSGWNYTVNDDGAVVQYGAAEEDYLTDVLARDAQRFLLAVDGPFYLQITPRAPHLPANPAPRHEGLFPLEKYPRGPAYNEASVADKPSMVARLPRLTLEQHRQINRDWRNRLRSVQAVDEMVAGLVDTLASQGKLDSTYFLFASDNGFHLGEHRMTDGKNTPYAEDTRVPAFIVGPGIPAGTVFKELIGNVDVPITLADAAGVTPPPFVDGRSFLPLVEGQQNVEWRTSYLLGRGEREGVIIGYSGVQTVRYTYIEYENGEREFYDLATDPYQLLNSYETMLPSLRDELSARVAALKDCAGDQCRAVEALPLS